jgi:EcoEI R protein C-terminal
VPAHQLGSALDGVPDVEQLPDQGLDPAQSPPLVISEPVRQRAFPQLELEPGPLLRAQPLPRHRALRPQRLGPAVLPGPVPPPHRTFRDPQVMRDLADRVAAGEPPGGLQPQPLTPLLLGGRVPAPLRIPHASVIRPRPPDVTTLSSTSSVWLVDKNPALLAIREGRQASDDQLIELEQLLHRELSNDDISLSDKVARQAFGMRLEPHLGYLGFARDLLQLDAIPDYATVVAQMFEQHIANNAYNAGQSRFLRAVQEVFIANGSLSQADLYDPPLTSFGRNAVDRFFAPDEIANIIGLAEQLEV